MTHNGRRVRLGQLVLSLAICHSGIAVCSAQEPSVAGVTVGLSSVPAGDTDRPYLGPGFGGSALGGLLFMHRGIRDRLSVGGEASMAADITGRQQQRVIGGANNLTSRHHDTVFSGVFKVSLLSVDLSREPGTLLVCQPPRIRRPLGEAAQHDRGEENSRQALDQEEPLPPA